MSRKIPRNHAKASFSRRFDAAVVEMRIIDAIVKSDDWNLAQFTNAPPWLREVYKRHAIAAIQEIHEIEKSENSLKPSEHQ